MSEHIPGQHKPHIYLSFGKWYILEGLTITTARQLIRQNYANEQYVGKLNTKLTV